MESNQVTKVEMERWFIARKSDLPFVLYDLHKFYIMQYYISTKPIVRVRSTLNTKDNTTEFILCLKSKIASSCGLNETEIPLTKKHFDELSQHASGRAIKKNRFIYEMNQHENNRNKNFKVEIDDFISYHPHIAHDEIKIEIEFDEAADYNHFHPPVWFGKEVTGQREYSNSFLSTL